jgi:hypothetical protein
MPAHDEAVRVSSGFLCGINGFRLPQTLYHITDHTNKGIRRIIFHRLGDNNQPAQNGGFQNVLLS